MSNLAQQEIDDARNIDIVTLIEGYGIKVEKRGTEHFACCPFHNERSPSFTVTPRLGRFWCFGCGESGTTIDFVMKYEGVRFRDAVTKLNGGTTVAGNVPVKRTIEREAVPEWMPMPVVPDSAPAYRTTINRKVDGNWVNLPESARWAYRNLDGQLIGYIVRFNKPEGGKEVIPQTYCTNTETGEIDWQWQSFEKPRPLYGLEKLKANPKAQVIFVEGEKDCEGARARFAAASVPESKVIVMSWAGGGKAVKHTDFSPVFGRKVGLWQDADQQTYKEGTPKAGQVLPFLEQPGTLAMLDVYDTLKEHCAVKWFMPFDGAPDGWGAADADPVGFDLLAFVKSGIPAEDVAAMRDAAPVAEAEPESDESMPWDDVPSVAEVDAVVANVVAPEPAAPKLPQYDDLGAEAQNRYFAILGYNRGMYYIFQFEKRQILEYTKGDFGDSGLIELAPLAFWETHFPGEKASINKKAALNSIIRCAGKRGIYDIGSVRGRGAWVDNGRMIYHHGHMLSVDGVMTDVTALESKYVYELTKKLPMPADVSLSNDEGRDLLEVAKMFRWTKPASSALLMGWIMLAPLSGAMIWRPHIWVTGGAGSGKSTLLNSFIYPLMAGNAIYAQGSSSEAGIRQELKADALPVLIDESEQNDEREKMRVQQILALIRQASTESPAKTFKGTAGGESMSFHIRSMFCLASIQVGIKHQADEERLTKLVLKTKTSDKDDDTWSRISDALYMINRDKTLAARLFRRSLNLLPIIQKNIEVFISVAAKHFGTQREGDQYGTMMAGAWCISCEEVATPEQALSMINQYDWSEHTESHDSDDSVLALSSLMGCHIRVPGGVELTVFELMRSAAARPTNDVTIEADKANAILQRYGIKVRGDRMLISNKSDQLTALMKETSYSADLKGVLLRLPGADRNENKPVKFNGVQAKCISIDIAELLLDEVSVTF